MKIKIALFLPYLWLSSATFPLGSVGGWGLQCVCRKTPAYLPPSFTPSNQCYCGDKKTRKDMGQVSFASLLCPSRMPCLNSRDLQALADL
jgi:hypothetical protein